jgi:hypothetical protein
VIRVNLAGFPDKEPVYLMLGSGVLDPPLPTAWGDFHLEAPVLLSPLASIPKKGVLSFPVMILAHPWAPYELPLQAIIGTELSNPAGIEVRD